MSKTVCTLAAAGFILASALPAAAQQKPQEPIERTRPGADRPGDAADAAEAATPRRSGPVVQAGPTVNLTEQEAVARAPRRNLTLISERITPQTWDFSMAATRATYADEPDLGRRQQHARYA